MLEPLTFTTEVPCEQKRAFETFIHGMGNWWPLDKRAMSKMDGENPKSLTVEPKLGGKIVELSDSGKEHHWGTITLFDPFAQVAMDFHMGMPPEQSSLLEVAFNPIDDARTQIVLTHSNWEGFGDMAEMIRGGYEESWDMLLGEFHQAVCAG